MLVRALLSGCFVVACGACSSAKLVPNGSDAGAPNAPNTPGAAVAQTVTVFDRARVSSDPSLPNFQQVSADVDFSAGPFTSATLVADLGSTCFPFTSWKDDPPPIGQNYPADCDAFDRNFELSLDDPPGDAGGSPGLELVRAITPFGGPMHIEQDLTLVANALPGVHHLRARIPTWSDSSGQISGSNGGWDLSVRLELLKGAPEKRPLAVIPLFYGDLLSADPMSADFETPAGTVSAYLEYRTTGHGSAAGPALECSGPAEEFCRREHTLTLDGAPLQSFTPWRNCASRCTLVSTGGDAGLSYCAENPCGDVNSVKAPRANWCPGAETPPLTITSSALAVPGAHELSWHVAEIAAGGSVHVSITYYAFAG